jgi:hypothetical protein
LGERGAKNGGACVACASLVGAVEACLGAAHFESVGLDRMYSFAKRQKSGVMPEVAICNCSFTYNFSTMSICVNRLDETYLPLCPGPGLSFSNFFRALCGGACIYAKVGFLTSLRRDHSQQYF